MEKKRWTVYLKEFLGYLEQMGRRSLPVWAFVLIVILVLLFLFFQIRQCAFYVVVPKTNYI